MRQRESAAVTQRSPTLAVLCAAAAATGALAYATSPTLGHFAGAIVPWPAHGLSAALVMAAPARQRVQVALCVGISLALGLAPVAFATETAGGPARLIAAVALLVAQALVTALLYRRFAGDTSPLAGTTAYAQMLLAVVVGSLPTTAAASLLLRLSGTLEGTGYSGWAWLIAAASSGAAIIGPVIALLGVDGADRRITPARAAELVALVTIFTLALASAFAEVGPLGGEITPALASLPFLVWSGLRYGSRGFAVVALLLVAWVTASTWLGLGPFAAVDESRLEQFRRAWIYAAALVGPAMIFPVAIEERAEADRRTRVALAQLRALFGSARDLIAAVDRDLTLIAVNEAWIASFERLTGVRAEVGMRIADLHAGLGTDGELSMALWQRALDGETFTVERSFGMPPRAREDLEVSYAPVRDEAGVVVGASHVIRSISDRRRREAEEAEARRLEGLGRLAGGVAHDFNNLMASVGGYADLILADLPDDAPVRGDVLEIQSAARRAASLTQQLLAFARRREVHPRDVDAAELLQGMTGLLRPLLGSGISLEVQVPSECPRILIDPTQLEQVVLNLVVNARDAMPRGGRIRVALAVAADATDQLELVVEDTGDGMPPDVQARIFEPFYTTKPAGKGTGLGLSTVHGIVHQAGGTIAVESTVGRGTTFRVRFPFAGVTTTPAPASPPPAAPRTP